MRLLEPRRLVRSTSATLVGPTSTEQVGVVRATASLLGVLGEHVALGRGFPPDENVLDGPKVALVSWENWTSRYGGDSSVVGRQVTFDNGTYTIVVAARASPRSHRAAGTILDAGVSEQIRPAELSQPQLQRYRTVEAERHSPSLPRPRRRGSFARRRATRRLPRAYQLAVRSNREHARAVVHLARRVGNPAPHRLRERRDVDARRSDVART